ncbi:FecR family protein [Halorhodospira halochloris]|uniref:FecR family protein n=1 Tax=Halorhodospira halochloris TaxID=1052 RepID=UPI001EE8611B|nr:FecR family protein [Halorhodospira halochloris]MCG5530779.1 FecR family protein [Halorhodospira halochloris]
MTSSLCTKKVTHYALPGVALAAGLFAAPAAVLAGNSSIGMVLATRGDVYAERDDSRRSLSRRDEIYVGDTIHTASNARAQIRLNDDQSITLRSDTRLTFEHFEFDAEEQSGETRKSLIEGGMRAITGAIRGEENYSIETPVAVIGVRGTISEIAHGENFGTVGGTPRGSGWVENAGASPERLLTGEDQPDTYFQVIDAETPPEPLPSRPVQLDSVTQDVGEDEDDEPEEDEAEEEEDQEDEPDDQDEPADEETEDDQLTDESADGSDSEDTVTEAVADQQREVSEEEVDDSVRALIFTSDPDSDNPKVFKASVKYDPTDPAGMKFELADNSAPIFREDGETQAFGSGGQSSWGAWVYPAKDPVVWITGRSDLEPAEFKTSFIERLEVEGKLQLGAIDGVISGSPAKLLGEQAISVAETDFAAFNLDVTAGDGLNSSAEMLLETAIPSNLATTSEDQFWERWHAEFSGSVSINADDLTLEISTVSGRYQITDARCLTCDDHQYLAEADLSGEVVIQLYGDPDNVGAGALLHLEADYSYQQHIWNDGELPDEFYDSELIAALYLQEGLIADIDSHISPPEKEPDLPDYGNGYNDEIPYHSFDYISFGVAKLSYPETTTPLLFFPAEPGDDPHEDVVFSIWDYTDAAWEDEPDNFQDYLMSLERGDDELLDSGESTSHEVYWGAWGQKDEGGVILPSASLYAGEELGTEYPVVWLYGRSAFSWDDNQYDAMLSRLESDGIDMALEGGILVSTLPEGIDHRDTFELFTDTPPKGINTYFGSGNLIFEPEGLDLDLILEREFFIEDHSVYELWNINDSQDPELDAANLLVSFALEGDLQLTAEGEKGFKATSGVTGVMSLAIYGEPDQLGAGGNLRLNAHEHFWLEDVGNLEELQGFHALEGVIYFEE